MKTTRMQRLAVGASLAGAVVAGSLLYTRNRKAKALVAKVVSKAKSAGPKLHAVRRAVADAL